MKAFNPAVIIQSRFGSTRLPGKSVAAIGGKTLLGWLIEGACAMRLGGRIVVAAPDTKENDVIGEIAEGMGALCVRGEEEDVLARFYRAAAAVGADPVIRLCADSPLLASDFMDALVESHREKGADLTHGAASYPLGALGEVISFAALEASFREAGRNHHREHVSPFIHENPARFKIHAVKPPVWMQRDFRFTIDTEKDLEMMRTLFSEVSGRGLAFNFTNAMAVLDVKPEIARINIAVPQRDWRAENNTTP